MLTIRELSEKTGIPESTIRYYRSKYPEFIPAKVGSGKKRRYGEDVVDVLRSIAEMNNRNINAEGIKEALALHYQPVYDTEEESQHNSAAAQQDGLKDVLSGILGELKRMNDLQEKQLYLMYKNDVSEPEKLTESKHTETDNEEEAEDIEDDPVKEEDGGGGEDIPSWWDKVKDFFKGA